MIEAAVEPGPTLLVGSPIAKQIRAHLRDEMADFAGAHGRSPTLVVVFVGRDAPSAVYLQQILKSCENVGAVGRVVELADGSSADDLRRAIGELNDDASVDGIIVQMPLPPSIPLRAVIDAIDPTKDIDGLHPMNAGLLAEGYDGFLPATAQAAVEILKRSGIRIEGRHAVVVGRSNVVGKPAALLLLREHATVTICHSRTVDLAAQTRMADIVIVAAGVPGLITGDMLKPGAAVVDVGINVVDDGIVGDVDMASAREVVGAISPVPGGVGPLTNAILMQHLLEAARQHPGG
ncbi:MAG TPA: bifunctional 5,10-methylenetetrahydrofolate dehydrogenase/5,10-methenyltetrahydrofolate cyclohydrolase [Candidatus Limnocylindrales bacterium]